MSGKQSGLVWDHVIAGNKRLVLLALAEAAEHDGTRCYPSIGRLVWMTGLGRRTVQRAIDYLSSPEVGVLVKVRDEQPRRPTEWRLEIQRLARKAPFRRGDRGERVGAKMTPSTGGPDEVPAATSQGANGERVGASLVAPDSSSYSSDDSSESAVSRWIELRRGLPRYRFIDASAIATLRAGIRDAEQRGVSAAVIRAAIEEAARRPFANPAGAEDGVSDWIAVAAERDARERRERAEAEARNVQKQERDAASEASWQELERQHPGRTRRELVEMALRGEVRADDVPLRLASHDADLARTA